MALVLIGLGVFLLVLSPLLAYYVKPQAKRTPIDVNITTVFTGKGSYFDQGSLSSKKGQDLKIVRRVLGNVAASEKSGNAVWDVSTTIDNPDTVKLKDPRKSFQWQTERWVTDRATNKAVHCCGEQPKRFEGEAYLKFPFDVEKRTYTWWDSTLGATVPLRYDGKQKVLGHEGLRFTGTVKPTQAGTRQVPGRLVGAKSGQVNAEQWYSNSGIELIVDQRTGRILRATIEPRMSLRAPGGDEDKVTLLQSDGMRFTEKTQRQAVDLAKADNRKLVLVGSTAPITGGITGALLALVGAVLLVRGRRTPAHRGQP
ncbi:DUF3068 domain-containing protein [Streptomyces sp. NPDC005438]|uniref:DUF3068 domain-containing protein n=1 Tax=Streptomyces sp. NPDC005438 TaxID=3156880 RepID=UPI0033A81719